MLSSKELDQKFTINDNHGNSLICVDGNLTTKLAIDNREPIYIGRVEYITYSNNTSQLLIYSKNEDEKNIHQKQKAWAIYWAILCNVDGVVLYVGKDKFAIKTEKAKSEGLFLPMAKEAIAKLFYIPLSSWKISKIE